MCAALFRALVVEEARLYEFVADEEDACEHDATKALTLNLANNHLTLRHECAQLPLASIDRVHLFLAHTHTRAISEKGRGPDARWKLWAPR